MKSEGSRMYRLEKVARPLGFEFRSRFKWFSENIGALKILSVTEESPADRLNLADSERLMGLQLRTTIAVRHLALGYSRYEK